MELISQAVDFVLHLDKHLNGLIQMFGGWTYGLLFVVIFCETGLVVTPFLPGDSLIFAAGAFPPRPDPSRSAGCFSSWPRPRSWATRPITGSERSSAPRSSPRRSRGFSARNISTGRTAFTKIRGRDDHPRPVRADRPDVRSVRGRNRPDELWQVSQLQRRRGSGLGGLVQLRRLFFRQPLLRQETLQLGDHRHHPDLARPGPLGISQAPAGQEENGRDRGRGRGSSPFHSAEDLPQRRGAGIRIQLKSVRSGVIETYPRSIVRMSVSDEPSNKTLPVPIQK